MGDSSGKDAELSDILASAPRHGMNAKALLLQAAALAAQEAASLEGETLTVTSDRDQQIVKLKAAFVGASKLLTGIPKRESPVVAFVNTAKVPRIVRQQVLQKLAGQHLAAALLDAGAQLTAAEVAARDDLRKAALAAATEQEVQLFKSCQSKVSYQNLAARTDASLIWYPPEVTPAAKPTPTPTPTPMSASAHQTAPIDSPSDANCHHQESMVTAGSNGALDTCGQGSNKRQKLGGTEDKEEQLLDEDIDWTAPSTVAQDVENEPDALDSAVAFNGSEAIAQSEPKQQKPSQEQQHVTVAVAGDREQPDGGGPPLSPDAKRVQNAVNEYIRAFLDPFYKAGIVTKEMYKLVMKKAVAKVMQSHSNDEETDFLISESDHIQKLVREYIRYAQKKLNSR